MKRPWNRINLPVYSISSKDDQGNANMHIITYAQAVSMQPKLFICAVYHGTKTLELIQKQPVFVLQLLSAKQYNLIHLLGHQSGNDIDKIGRLHKRKAIVNWEGFWVLNDALAVMKMEATQLDTKKQEPDHCLFLCKVTAYKNLNEGVPLTLDILREKKLIRM